MTIPDCLLPIHDYITSELRENHELLCLSDAPDVKQQFDEMEDDFDDVGGDPDFDARAFINSSYEYKIECCQQALRALTASEYDVVITHLSVELTALRAYRDEVTKYVSNMSGRQRERLAAKIGRLEQYLRVLAEQK
ncbi:MAG: hypothetical protein JWN18_407 [Parcubacteria group bacterium]|nr:hypothetical protein [Parcubacteria group bacterium]